MLPAVKRVGNAYAARRGRRSGDRGSTRRSLSTTNSPVEASRDHARARSDALAGPGYDLSLGAEQHIHPRPELDQPDALARVHVIPGMLAEHDAASDQSGDLLEN